MFRYRTTESIVNNHMQSFKVFWENHNPLSRLYHKTGIESLIKILGSNQFKLTVANSAFERFIVDRRPKRNNRKDPTYNYKKNYYLSTARSMYNTYYKNDFYHQRPFSVIELDSSKLADRYEIIPVDYWHPSKSPGVAQKDETEDRIISKESDIQNARKYITRIFVYAGDGNELSRKNINIIANSGLPVYLFHNREDLYLRNIKKAELITGHNEEVVPSELYAPETNEVEKYKVQELNDLYKFITNPTIENREKIKRPIGSADELINITSGSKVQEIRDAVYKFQELQRKTNKSIRSLLVKAIEEFDKRYNS